MTPNKEGRVEDLNKEVAIIKKAADATGCNCKPVKLDKLSTGKMRAQLIELQSTRGTMEGLTGASIASMSKPELLSAMRSALNNCPLCVSNECDCVRVGVQCSAEVCGCLRRGLNGEGQRCHNPEGSSIFDVDKVRDYRVKMLLSLGCFDALQGKARTRAATVV